MDPKILNAHTEGTLSSVTVKSEHFAVGCQPPVLTAKLNMGTYTHDRESCCAMWSQQVVFNKMQKIAKNGDRPAILHKGVGWGLHHKDDESQHMFLTFLQPGTCVLLHTIR
jgi:hypothetical protein|mmetsp:Transcript_109628/g.186399  ORF Transcript_109628/g.186399 Transcript_109628/m.186399 type:complete len:111 (-) Transcript_109628:486-818(-)